MEKMTEEDFIEFVKEWQAEDKRHRTAFCCLFETYKAEPLGMTVAMIPDQRRKGKDLIEALAEAMEEQKWIAYILQQAVLLYEHQQGCDFDDPRGD